MTLKHTSALVAFLLAAGPVLGQEVVPLADNGAPAEAEQVFEVDQPADEAAPSVPTPSQGIYPQVLGYQPAWTERIYYDVGYVMGFVQGVHLPALVTTSVPGTPQSQAGVLGPSSNVLFGDHGVDTDMRSGFRMCLGGWIDENRIFGVEIGGFWMSGLDQTFNASSNGSTILARPFTDANTGVPASLLVAFPNGSGPTGASSSGNIAVSASSGSLYGAHFDLQESIINDPGFRLKSLLGYRYISFSDDVDITQNMFPVGGSPAAPPGTHIFSQDNFAAINTFNGAEIGLQAEFIRGPFAATLLAKVAAGSMERDVHIAGNTLITAPGNAPVSTAGGLLALPTNIGVYHSNVFAVVPEVGLNLSWNVTSYLRLTAGYSILVINHAVRAGDQIDTTVNSNLLNSSLTASSSAGTAQRPAFNLEQSNLWVQSVNLGLELRY